jgi:UDP-glucose 4-epimerase
MTKVAVEYLMKSQAIASPDFCFIALRYFNPAGAHKSALIGDSPTVYPNNLFPFIE